MKMYVMQKKLLSCFVAGLMLACCGIATASTQKTSSAAPDKVAVGYYTVYGDKFPGDMNAGPNDNLLDTVNQGYNVIDLAFFQFSGGAVNDMPFKKGPGEFHCGVNGISGWSSCVEYIKNKYKNVKFIASVGGMNTPDSTMQFVFPDAKNTQSHVNTLIDYINTNHLDGVDFDLEPVDPVTYAPFIHPNYENYVHFIDLLHKTDPSLIITFAPSGPDLWNKQTGKYLYLDLWKELLKNQDWNGWFQVQYYNQDSTQPNPGNMQHHCTQNQPFDSAFEGDKCESWWWGKGKSPFLMYVEVSDPDVHPSVDNVHEAPQYKVFDRHFVIGTPASAFASNNFMGMDYVPSGIDTADQSVAFSSECSDLLLTAKNQPTPTQIITNYYNNAVKNGHPNVRGFMTWDTFNDYDAYHYDCSKSFGKKYAPNKMVSWKSYDWIRALQKLFLKPGPGPKPGPTPKPSPTYQQLVTVQINGLLPSVKSPEITVSNLTHTAITEPVCNFVSYKEAQCTVAFKDQDKIQFHFAATGKYVPVKGNDAILTANGKSLDPKQLTVSYKQKRPPAPPPGPTPSQGDCIANILVTKDNDGSKGYYAQFEVKSVEDKNHQIIWSPSYEQHINTQAWSLTVVSPNATIGSVGGFVGSGSVFHAMPQGSYYRAISIATNNAKPIKYTLSCHLDK